MMKVYEVELRGHCRDHGALIVAAENAVTAVNCADDYIREKRLSFFVVTDARRIPKLTADFKRARVLSVSIFTD